MILAQALSALVEAAWGVASRLQPGPLMRLEEGGRVSGAPRWLWDASRFAERYKNFPSANSWAAKKRAHYPLPFLTPGSPPKERALGRKKRGGQVGKLFFRLDCHKPTTLVFGLLLNDGWRDRGSTTIVCRVSPGRRMCTSNVYHLSPLPRVGLSLLEGSRSRVGFGEFRKSRSAPENFGRIV